MSHSSNPNGWRFFINILSVTKITRTVLQPFLSILLLPFRKFVHINHAYRLHRVLLKSNGLVGYWTDVSHSLSFVFFFTRQTVSNSRLCLNKTAADKFILLFGSNDTQSVLSSTGRFSGFNCFKKRRNFHTSLDDWVLWLLGKLVKNGWARKYEERRGIYGVFIKNRKNISKVTEWWKGELRELMLRKVGNRAS